MDDNLYYVLVGTGVVSVLTLIYVLVDENLKQRRYYSQQAEEAAPSPAEDAETAVSLTTQEIAAPESTDPASTDESAPPATADAAESSPSESGDGTSSEGSPPDAAEGATEESTATDPEAAADPQQP